MASPASRVPQIIMSAPRPEPLAWTSLQRSGCSHVAGARAGHMLPLTTGLAPILSDAPLAPDPSCPCAPRWRLKPPPCAPRRTQHASPSQPPRPPGRRVLRGWAAPYPGSSSKQAGGGRRARARKGRFSGHDARGRADGRYPEGRSSMRSDLCGRSDKELGRHLKSGRVAKGGSGHGVTGPSYPHVFHATRCLIAVTRQRRHQPQWRGEWAKGSSPADVSRRGPP